jgi:UDP-perosamine 4-acetyltransferase
MLGAGGHARSVLEALRGADDLEIIGATDPRAELAGTEIDGIPVLGDDSGLAELQADGVEAAFVGLGGTGDNAPRAALYERAKEIGFALPAVVHHAAVIASTAELAEASITLAAAVLGPGVIVGENSIVNTGAIVDHDCEIGAHAHIATGARLAGDVRVGTGAHIGVGASVLGGIEIGERAVVGAGAVVIADVPAGTTVAGVPAKELR